MRARASQPAKETQLQVVERRRKERRATGGEVVLRFENPEAVEIRGQLQDISADGFRARHGWLALSPGQLVRFHHPFAEGVARVVWNRVLGDGVETGFHILPVPAC